MECTFVNGTPGFNSDCHHSLRENPKSKQRVSQRQLNGPAGKEKGYVQESKRSDRKTSRFLQPSNLPLNDIEQTMCRYLSQAEPELCQMWVQELPASRESITTQLQTALKREGIHEDQELIMGLQTDWKKLKTELMDSAANLALSRALVRQRGQQLRDRYPENQNLLSIMEEQRSPSEIIVQLDSLDAEGHPSHPGRKTKLGFSPKDSLSFSCEAHQQVSLKIVALRHDRTIQSDESFIKVLQCHYPFIIDAAVEGLQRRGYDANLFLFTVSHPFQFNNIIPQVYKEEIQTGIIVLLPEVTLSARPTNSTRTLLTANPGVMGKHLAIKTSIQVRIGSIVRTLTTATVRSGPFMSMLVTRLLESNSKVSCLIERAGIAFADKLLNPLGSLTSEERSRVQGLSCVLREDAQDYGTPNELVIRCSALTTVSPISGQHFIMELLNSGVDTTLSSAAETFLDTYADLLLGSTLPLLWKYGIAVTAHLQNTLLVLNRHGYRPTKLLLQDLGDAAIYCARFLEAAKDIRDLPIPESKWMTNDIDYVYSFFTHTVILINLKLVVDTLAGSNKILEECQAWGIIRRQIEKIYDRFKETSGPRSTAVMHANEHLDYLLHSPVLPEKAFVRMKLLAKFGYKEYFFMRRNPLYEPRSQISSV